MSVLKNATVVIKGNDGGKTVTLTGNLKDFEIKDTTPGVDEYSVRHISSRYLLRPNTYSLDFTPDDEGKYYHIKVEEPVVVRTARVEASDRSVEGLENARVRAGAPKNAKVRIEDFSRTNTELFIDNLDNPTPVVVEFRWKD